MNLLCTSPESFEPSISPLLDLHCLLRGHVSSLELWVEGKWGGGDYRRMIETCGGGAVWVEVIAGRDMLGI